MSHSKLIKVLKAVTILVGVIGALVYLVLIPRMIQSDVLNIKEYTTSWCAFIWGSAIPCYIALVQFFQIVQTMEQEESFSRGNAVRLQRIAILSFVDTAYFFIGSSVFYILNISHPLMLILCLVILVAGIGIGIIAAVLSRLVEKAVEMKEENELTI